MVFTVFEHTKLHPFQNLSLGFILKIFLKFRKFQPRYSYKIYSYRKKRVYSLVIFRDPLDVILWLVTLIPRPPCQDKSPSKIADDWHSVVADHRKLATSQCASVLHQNKMRSTQHGGFRNTPGCFGFLYTPKACSDEIICYLGSGEDIAKLCAAVSLSQTHFRLFCVVRDFHKYRGQIDTERVV